MSISGCVPSGLCRARRQISKSFPYFGEAFKKECEKRNTTVCLEPETSARAMQGLFVAMSIRIMEDEEGQNMLNHEKGAPPLYSQLESIIKMQIERGEYNRGDFLPTEKMLMDQYEVSRVTVRQAMAALSQAGYIKCSRGIGTEVIYEKINEHMKSVISLRMR